MNELTTGYITVSNLKKREGWYHHSECWVTSVQSKQVLNRQCFFTETIYRCIFVHEKRCTLTIQKLCFQEKQTVPTESAVLQDAGQPEEEAQEICG